MYPFINFFGKQFGSYGIMMALGILVAGVLSIIRAKRNGQKPEDIIIVAATSIAFALLGGTGLYILVSYSPKEIAEQIRNGSFDFLKNGGLVFYGSLIGGCLGAPLGLRLAKCGFSETEYAIIPFIPLGHAIGRVGCLLAGCCYGFRYDGPLAIYYTNSISGLTPTDGYFPIQISEAFLNLICCTILLYYGKKKRKSGSHLALYLCLYSVERFTVEFFRGDVVRGFYAGLSSSQWISIFLFIFSLFFLLTANHICDKILKKR